MRYSCRAVVGHGQKCEPNYQCDACAAKQKYIPRIEKLESALRYVYSEVKDEYGFALVEEKILVALAEEKKDD